MSDHGLPPHALSKLFALAEPLAARKPFSERYRIVREVGRGGMGVVYEAIDLELERRVALKKLALPPGAGDALRARFAREAAAAARLAHPNIAAVHEASADTIVMQFVDGSPLSARRDLPREKLLSLVRDAALAVHAAHAEGIVHRDLKPQNLLVEGERVVVTDFGLAKLAGENLALSATGHVLGTPAYMSPEQAAGGSRPIDARTDVYGLGATLYDLLAGRPPFVAGEDDDVARLLARIIEEEAPPIAGVPRDLDTLVRKCLEKDPARRYDSARDLAEDLTRFLDGRPVLARPPSLAYRFAKLARRHRALVLLGAASAAALLAASVLMLAERARRTASVRALALSSEVFSVLRDFEAHERLGEKAAAERRLADGIAACRSFLAEDDVAMAHLLLARCERLRGGTESALAALDAALRIDPALAEARLERGLLLAAEVRSRAVRLSPPADPADPAALPADLRAVRDRALADLAVIEGEGAAALGLVDAEFARAEVARLRGDRVAARKGYAEVTRLDRLHAGALLAMSDLDLAEGKGDAAWHLAMSAIDLHRGFGPAYVARSAAESGAASGDGAADPVAGALRQHEFAAAEARVAAGDRSPEALLLRGTARLRIADVDGALADMTSALAADPSDATAYGNRALVHARQASALAAEGKIASALAAWDASVSDCTAALTLEPHLAGALNNRGVARSEREWLLAAEGRSAEAAAEREAAGEDFSAAIERAPRFALAFLNRAMQRRRVAEARLASRDLAGAGAAIAGGRADLEAVLALKPGDAEGLLEGALLSDLESALEALRGRAALAAEASERALAGFDAAVAAAPEDARTRGLRGIHRVRRGDAAGGAADLDAALSLSPDARARRLFERERAAAR